MYIDLHNHYLPNVDDGIKDIEETIKALQLAQKEKVSVICMTPHIWAGRFDNNRDNLLKTFNEVKEKAKEIQIELHLASEVHYTPTIVEDYKAGRFLTLGTKKKYLLIELPMNVLPKGVKDNLHSLMLEGVEPIIVHPERYRYFQENLRLVEDFYHMEILFQVTTHSLIGLLGKDCQKTAIKMIDKSLISFVASDAHNITDRSIIFREAVRFLFKRYGLYVTKSLTIDNPKRVLEGNDVYPVKPKKIRRTFFEWG